MKFNSVSPSMAVSACGNYEIRLSATATGKTFYNAWHTPTDKHVDAGFLKTNVKAACQAHADKVGL